MKWIKDRLKEPSTWGAIAAGLMAIGVSVDAPTIGAIAGGVAAVIGIVFPEQSA